MKHVIAASAAFLLAAVTSNAQISVTGVTTSAASANPVQSSGNAELRQPIDLSSTRVSTITSFVDAVGKKQFRTNSYVEIANGLNYATTNGVLLPSVPEFTLIEGAAIAWRGGTKLSLGATLDSTAPVQIRLPSGELMSSRLQGLSVSTPQGQSVLIADIKEGVQGILVASNVVVYPDCFNGAVQGDLRYTVQLSGIEQDIVIRSSTLSSPDTLAGLGLPGVDPNSLVIEGLTEFLTGPDPQVQPVLRQDSLNGQAVNIADNNLQFGPSMRMGAGRSFMAGQEDQTLGFVSKSWVRTPDQRNFLIEQIPLSIVEAQIPVFQPSKPGAMKASGRFFKTRLEALNSLPKGRKEVQEARKILPLKAVGKGLLAWLGQPGVIVDYSTISGGLTNYTWLGTSTYLISSATTLYGTNTICEAGSVLKYASNASVTVTTPVTWQGSAYRPVVLCAKDDNSSGEVISGSTGAPSNYPYASTALILDASTNGAVNTTFNLAHLRIANANTAIQIIQGTNGHTIRHAQFVNCGSGIAPSSTTLSVYNALFAGVGTNFNGSATVGDLEHITSDTAAIFAQGSTFSSVGLTNCLFTAVANANVGSNTNQVAILSSNSGVFQNLSLGTSHYLPTNSIYRCAGTTGIDPTLAGDLIDMVTTAPTELGTNYSVGTNLPLQPVVPRNTGIPDLGYHEYALDYVVKGISVTGTNTLSLINGVAVGFYGSSGFTPATNAKVSSFGLPESLNRLTLVNTVFEQPQPWISNTSGFVLINGPGQNLRFTDVSYLAAGTGGRQICPTILSGTMNVQDCQLRGVYWKSYNYSGSGSFGGTINLRNSLLDHCTIDWTQGYAGTPYYLYFAWQNNLFTKSSIALTHCSYYYGSWTAYDCVYDSSTGSLTEYGGGSNVPWTNFGCNGYISTTRFLSGTGDVTGLSRDFISGPLGDYYYPTNSTANSLSTLIHADTNTTRTPATSGIGLYHYTTTLDQTKEATNALSIGMHFVALESHRASVEFSGTNGLNNWYYGKSTAPLVTTFTYLPSFGNPYTGYTNVWYDASISSGNNDYFAWVFSNGQHPGASFDSLRIWQSTVGSRVSVWSTANASSTSDGVRLHIAKNAIALTPWVTSTAGVITPMNARGYVQPDDLLFFQLNMNASIYSDATTWDPLVVIHRGVSTLAAGLPDWFSNSTGSGALSGSDGSGDFDGDGQIDRLDSSPFNFNSSASSVLIERPVDGTVIP